MNNHYWKSDKLHTWLSNSVEESTDKRYSHRLMKENLSQRDQVMDELKRLVSQAYDEVRKRLQGFLAKEASQDDEWRNGVLRAAELLEWLNHPETNTNKLPHRKESIYHLRLFLYLAL